MPFYLAIAGIIAAALWMQRRTIGALLGESVRASSAAVTLADNASGDWSPAPGQISPYIAAMSPAVQYGSNNVRGFRNNNPGNIRDDGTPWQGVIGTDEAGYLIFATADDGLRAIARDLQTKMRRGVDSVRDIITAWAPPFENNTASYISHVAKLTGFAPDDSLPLNAATVGALVSAITVHENGSNPYPATLILSAVRAAGVA